jgi:hypothetical protein
MNESIKKFREEAKKLEQSDALKEARKKYVIFFVVEIIKFANTKRIKALFYFLILRDR